MFGEHHAHKMMRGPWAKGGGFGPRIERHGLHRDPGDDELFGDRGPSGRRRGRAVDSGELQLLLLSQLTETPRHGYDLIRSVEEASGGAYAPSPGMVYPALTYMEEAGLIAVASAEGSRKSFTATDFGREKLATDAALLATLEQRLAALAERHARTDVQPVRRAMHNLRSALMARLSVDDLPIDTQHRIVDIIDDAARQIERIA